MRSSRIGVALAANACRPPAALSTSQRLASAGGNSNHGNGRRVSTMNFGIDPAKLQLNLNLEKMDFAKVAEATKEALAHDRSASRLRNEVRHVLDRAADKTVDERKNTPGVPAPRSTPRDKQRDASAFGDGARTVRGIVGAGDVHDSNSPASAYAQRRRETQGSHAGRDVRYTLMDSLRDCMMSGNWLKAYKMFENAVEKAYNMILTPPAAAAGGTEPPGSSSSLPSSDRANPLRGSAKEKEVFEALAKVAAALPPRDDAVFDRSSDVARRRGMGNMVGVMRWNGGHFYLLLKILLTAERVEEAERVWTVMRDIGFVKYQVDERTLNSLIGLLRRSTQRDDATQRLVTPIVAPHKVGEQIGREKALKRQMAIELEEAARARNLRLRGANERTAAVARIAEAVHAQQHGNASDRPGLSSQLRVGDFNGLLRIAQSHEGTLRVLAMMDKLGIPQDATTFTNIIASHKNPKYRVDGASDAEVTAAAGAGEASDDGNGGGDGDDDAGEDHEQPVMNEETKRIYEAYKEKRIASARNWFDKCPQDARTASLYNEMLYLLRANAHRAEFDALLTQFRGNALRDPQDWAVIDEVGAKKAEQSRDERGGEAPASTGGDAPIAPPRAAAVVPTVPVIHAPAWTVPPNGRTYELLMRRCRYHHDWEGMWELYREMRAGTIHGSPKLYQQLLSDAKSHPPSTVTKHGDVSAFIMEVYKEMRRNNVDVNSVSTTVSLVNAWSATRSKRRWS